MKTKNTIRFTARALFFLIYWHHYINRKSTLNLLVLRNRYFNVSRETFMLINSKNNDFLLFLLNILTYKLKTSFIFPKIGKSMPIRDYRVIEYLEWIK